MMWYVFSDFLRALILGPLILLFGDERGRVYYRRVVWSGILLGSLLIVLLIAAVIYQAARP